MQISLFTSLLSVALLGVCSSVHATYLDAEGPGPYMFKYDDSRSLKVTGTKDSYNKPTYSLEVGQPEDLDTAEGVRDFAFKLIPAPTPQPGIYRMAWESLEKTELCVSVLAKYDIKLLPCGDERVTLVQLGATTAEKRNLLRLAGAEQRNQCFGVHMLVGNKVAYRQSCESLFHGATYWDLKPVREIVAAPVAAPVVAEQIA